MKRYKITLSENQLRVTQLALEEYFRLRLGQTMDFCDDLAFMDTDLSKDNPQHERIFDRAIQRRDHLQEILKGFFRIAFESSYGTPKEQSADMLTAQDIWDAMRTARGVNRWDRPIQVGGEPLPEIEVIENE